MTDQPNHSPSGLYAYTETNAVNLQAGVSLILDWWSDAQMLAAPTVASAMQLCRSFRTFDDHADVLMANVPELAGQRANVMSVLDMVRDNGLMVTAESVCEKLNADVPNALDLPASRVFVITCDRPAAVERLLESMLRAGSLSQHEALFLIDDSRDPGNADLNRELVEKFNLTSPRDMHYFGADEARDLMQALILASPENEASIRFLIDRERWASDKTYGLARNLALLLSVGKRAIVMDDDVLCMAVNPPHNVEGVDFGSTEREADFFSSNEQMLQALTASDVDPIAGHTACLGLTMGQALRKLLGRQVTPDDLKGANSSYLNLWQANSPLLITQCGTLGDPGTRNTDWIYFAQGITAQRLANFPDGLQGALQSRSYWLGYPRPSFNKSSNMSQVTGLDNSKLLPPYFPLHRGEDALFGAMTEHMYPQSAVLSYNWAVPHLPLEQRTGASEPQPKDGKGLLSIPKYITDRTDYRDGASAAARLQSLSTTARQLGETGDRGLIHSFRQEAAELLGLEQSQVARVLNNDTIKPPLWQSWLEDSAEKLKQAMQHQSSPADIPGLEQGLTETEALAHFRAYATAFGGAMASWEALREAAAGVVAEKFA